MCKTLLDLNKPPLPALRLKSSLRKVAPFMAKSFSAINIKTDFMTKKPLMAKQTQSPCNT